MSSFVPASLEVPAEVAAGTPLAVNPRSQVALGLSGTFVADVQFQWSPDKTGSVWYAIGDEFSDAGGLIVVPAGRAQRVRANTTAYTSGTPVGTALHDLALDATLREKAFAPETLEVPASATTGAALNLEDGEQALVALSGTFTATVQIQVSLSAEGSDWFNWGPALSAAGTVLVPRGTARRIRANTTAYTSGTPAATVLRGLTAEPVVDGQPDTLAAAGALSLYTAMSQLDVDGTMAFTLGDGLYPGQIKWVTCIGAANTPDGTLTPTNFTDGTSLTIDAVTEQVGLYWTGAAWKLISIEGATINA